MTDEHGRPLAEAAVSLREAPVPVPDIAALTGPDGRFTLAAPAPGRYAVVAAAPGGGGARAQVQVGGGGAQTLVRLVVSAAGGTP